MRNKVHCPWILRGYFGFA